MLAVPWQGAACVCWNRSSGRCLRCFTAAQLWPPECIKLPIVTAPHARQSFGVENHRVGVDCQAWVAVWGGRNLDAQESQYLQKELVPTDAVCTLHRANANVAATLQVARLFDKPEPLTPQASRTLHAFSNWTGRTTPIPTEDCWPAAASKMSHVAFAPTLSSVSSPRRAARLPSTISPATHIGCAEGIDQARQRGRIRQGCSSCGWQERRAVAAPGTSTAGTKRHLAGTLR
jgi:hypothetical protein